MRHASPWYDLVDLTDPPPLAALPREVPVAIIGGGITGAAILYHFAERGIPALLIEREHCAAGATGRNAGFLIQGTVEYFDAAVERWGRAEAAAIWAFTLENIASLRTAIAKEQIACDLQPAGQVVLAASEAEWESIQRSVRLMKELGLETQLLNASGVAEQTGLSGFLGGRFQWDDSILNPAALVLGLVRAAVRQGGQLASGTAVESITPADPGWMIATSAGPVFAEHLVLANNAWLRELWPAWQEHVIPVRAQALATAPVAPGFLTGALSTNFGYEYWRQLPNGQVLLGGKRWTEPDQAVNTTQLVVQESTHARLVEFLHLLYPSLAEVPITHAWTGLMAFASDHLPLIGWIPGVTNACVAGGYTGHGMAFGFLAGRVLRDLILDGGTPLEVGRFDPGRFPTVAASQSG